MYGRYANGSTKLYSPLLLNRLNSNKKDRAYNSLDPVDLSFNNKHSV
jgi:hypothetical protein